MGRLRSIQMLLRTGGCGSQKVIRCVQLAPRCGCDKHSVSMSTSTSLPGQYTGWHHYCYPGHKFPCGGADAGCSVAPGAAATNYYFCKQCMQRQWFASKIASFNTDDITRAEAMHRFGNGDPLPVHSEMVKVHKKFRARGGIVRVLGHPRDLPKVTWTTSGRFIRGVVYPDHIRSDELTGTRRNIERAERLAATCDDPYGDE